MIVNFIACMVMALVMTPTKDEINDYIIEVATEYQVSPELIMAMVETESNYDVDAENGDCKGLMQVSQKWHKDRMDKLGVTDLYDPYSNILVGVDFISELSEDYQDIGLVLMLYNMKRSTAFEMYEKGELSGYAKKILERSAELEKENGK